MRTFEGLPVSSVDAGLVAVAVHEEAVEVILEVSSAEGEVADNDGEEDYAHGENICLPSVVDLSRSNFWSHVALSTSEGIQLIDILIGCEAEISEFQVHALV